jgi:alkaline phosphatase
LCGVKTRIGLIGVDGKTIFGNCKSSKNSKIHSIVKWAHDAGKSVGIVTTTRITHATPAAAYASSASREWETYDGKIFSKQQFDEGCKDIASQLVDDASYIDVRKFLYQKLFYAIYLKLSW